MDNETLIDWGDVSCVVSDVDHDTTKTITGVYLGHRTFNNSKSCNTETLEEDLAGAFIRVAGEAWGEGEEDGGLHLCAAEAQLVEQDVLPEGRCGSSALIAMEDHM